MKLIPYGRQCIEEDDIQGVVRVLKSDWLTQGPTLRKFEESFAGYCGAKYAVAASSGTAALHLACRAAGLAEGDEAVTTAMSFVGTANAVIYTGARPVLVDILYDTVNLDPEEVKKAMSPRTRAILPVHFSGLPADLREISNRARRRGILVIEDACHALGARYAGGRIGNCRYSDMAVFSFHPVKQITTGEGGCITTNHRRIYERLMTLRHHGIHRSPSLVNRFGGWFYDARELGFNYRMTDIQAALGLSQLKKLGRFLALRREIAERYHAAFSPYAGDVLLPKLRYPDREHAWHLYLLRLNLGNRRLSRRKLYEALRENGVQSQVHYVPIFRYASYRDAGFNGKNTFPNTERYYREALSLPIFPSLSERDVQKVIRLVCRYLEGKSPKGSTT